MLKVTFSFFVATMGAATCLILWSMLGRAIDLSVMPIELYFTLENHLIQFALFSLLSTSFLLSGFIVLGKDSSLWPPVTLFLLGAIITGPFLYYLSYSCPNDNYGEASCGGFHGFPWGGIFGAYGMGLIVLTTWIRRMHKKS